MFSRVMTKAVWESNGRDVRYHHENQRKKVLLHIFVTFNSYTLCSLSFSLICFHVPFTFVHMFVVVCLSLSGSLSLSFVVFSSSLSLVLSPYFLLDAAGGVCRAFIPPSRVDFPSAPTTPTLPIPLDLCAR